VKGAGSRQPAQVGGGEPWLPFGVLRRPHGRRGEILLAPYNVDADRAWAATLPMEVRWLKDGCSRDVAIVASLPVPGGFLVRFSSAESREVVAELASGEVQFPRPRLPSLSTEEFYVEDVVGFAAWSVGGQRLGQVVGSYWNGAHDVISIAADDGSERYLPVLPGFVLGFDIRARRLTVDLHE